MSEHCSKMNEYYSKMNEYCSKILRIINENQKMTEEIKWLRKSNGRGNQMTAYSAPYLPTSKHRFLLHLTLPYHR
jgi:hypothetical protein